MAIRNYRPRRKFRGPHSRVQAIIVYLVLVISFALHISILLLDPQSAGESIRVMTIAMFYWAAGAMSLHALIFYGANYLLRLLVITLSLSYLFVYIGSNTGWPYGKISYDGSLGFQIYGIPLVIPFIWLMMAHPILIVARRMTKHWVFLYGGLCLMAWDFALDPEMVAAERWHWDFSSRPLWFAPEVPFSNAVGWLLTGMALIAVLNFALPRERRKSIDNNPINIFLGWTILMSVISNYFFLDQPRVALASGIALSVLLIPYFLAISMGRNN